MFEADGKLMGGADVQAGGVSGGGVRIVLEG
jgi:hypothetical protein